jgi:glycosyltransferase involved in cell wall biosynthesis
VRELRLLVVSPYFPPHVGGLEGYANDLDEALLRTGEVAAITVFTPRLPTHAAASEAVSEHHRVVRYPAFELIPNFPVPKLWHWKFWHSVHLVRLVRHDVLVSHTRFFLTSALALIWARASSRPLLHVEHGSDYVQLDNRAARTAARAYDLMLGRALLRRADAVVAISRAAADFVRQLTGREVPVIYRGMHTERLDAARPDDCVLQWAGGRPVITFAGRLIDGKGVVDLLSAFSAMREQQAVLCIVGDGPCRGDLEALAERLGISRRVLLRGYLPETDAWAVMRASDVIVNPSYTEGLPTSVLEAALMGKAILASDVGGTTEIIADGESGLLVVPRDIDGLRAGLERLIGDSELRERLGEAAREQASGRFSWEQSAGRFIELTRRLARQCCAAHHTVDVGEAASTSSKTPS